jgi:hypothetical protein
LLVSHILAGSLTHGGAEQSETMSSMGGLVRRLRQPLNEVLEIYEFVTNNDRFRNEAFNRGARIRTGDLTDPNGARYQAAPRPDALASIPHRPRPCPVCLQQEVLRVA